jgi:hypothetical protein
MGVKSWKLSIEESEGHQRNTPSVSRFYNIKVGSDSQNNVATQLTWTKNDHQDKEREEQLGVYFIRTNMPVE